MLDVIHGVAIEVHQQVFVQLVSEAIPLVALVYAVSIRVQEGLSICEVYLSHANRKESTLTCRVY